MLCPPCLQIHGRSRYLKFKGDYDPILNRTGDFRKCSSGCDYHFTIRSNMIMLKITNNLPIPKILSSFSLHYRVIRNLTIITIEILFKWKLVSLPVHSLHNRWASTIRLDPVFTHCRARSESVASSWKSYSSLPSILGDQGEVGDCVQTVVISHGRIKRTWMVPSSCIYGMKSLLS